MSIYIAKDGKQFGPYPLEEVKQLLESEIISEADACWHEGCKDWIPVSQLVAHVPAPNKSIGPVPLELTRSSLGSASHKIAKPPTKAPRLLAVGILALLVCVVAVALMQKSASRSGTAGHFSAKNAPPSSSDIKNSPQVSDELPKGSKDKTDIRNRSWNAIVGEIEEEIGNGDPRAMAIMSVWMSVGMVKNDRAKATALASKSESMGCALGQYALASIRSISDETAGKEPYVLAYPKLLDLANSGDAFAQYAIATYYVAGFGNVEKNTSSAIPWLNMAIKQGQLEAIDLAGLLQTRSLERVLHFSEKAIGA